MDQFFQNFKSASEFFVLDDFIFNCAAALGEFYLQAFEAQRGELRQEKQDEVVAFSHDWLSEGVLKVKDLEAAIDFDFMSFPNDKQDSGIQEVFSVKPANVDLERSNLTEIWQYKFLPLTNRIFWRIDRKKIKFFNKGEGNISEVRVLYVPARSNTMEVPQSLVQYAIDTTVMKMKEKAQAVVVKKSLDGNQNKVLQTEIDPESLKGG